MYYLTLNKAGRLVLLPSRYTNEDVDLEASHPIATVIQLSDSQDGTQVSQD